MKTLAQLSEFSREKKEVVIETEQGKVRLTFEEWKQVADGYYALVEMEKDKKKVKALIFVEHIEKHLKYIRETPDSPIPKVICKICGKTIDEIYAEEQK